MSRFFITFDSNGTCLELTDDKNGEFELLMSTPSETRRKKIELMRDNAYALAQGCSDNGPVSIFTPEASLEVNPEDETIRLGCPKPSHLATQIVFYLNANTLDNMGSWLNERLDLE